MNNVLIRPVITEKSMQDAALSRYTFVVLKEANKVEIARDVAASFNVVVKSVKTSILKGKTHRTGKKRQETITAPWKKAVVEIEKGQKIELFDVTEGEHQHA